MGRGSMTAVHPDAVEVVFFRHNFPVTRSKGFNLRKKKSINSTPLLDFVG